MTKPMTFSDWLDEFEKRVKEKIYEHEMSIATLRRALLRAEKEKDGLNHGRAPAIYKLLLMVSKEISDI